MDEAVEVGTDPAERAHHAGADGPVPTPEPRRRMSARRKQDAVLRLLRGEPLEIVARGDWRNPPQKGERIYLNFDPEQVHVFSTKDGRRLG